MTGGQLDTNSHELVHHAEQIGEQKYLPISIMQFKLKQTSGKLNYNVMQVASFVMFYCLWLKHYPLSYPTFNEN